MKNILIIIFAANLSIILFGENQIRFEPDNIEVIDGKSYILFHLEDHYASRDDMSRESVSNTNTRVSSGVDGGVQPKFTSAFKKSRDFVKFSYQNPKFIFSNLSYKDFEQYGKNYDKIPYQLPEEILGSLTTEELILYCCDHPSLKFASIRTCAKSKLAIEKDEPEALSQFNGYKELIRRSNFILEILDLLEESCIENSERKKNIEKYIVTGNIYKNYDDISILAGALFSLISSRSIYHSITEQDRINVTLLVKKMYESRLFSSSVGLYAFLINYHYEHIAKWREYFVYESPVIISIKKDLSDVFYLLARGAE